MGCTDSKRPRKFKHIFLDAEGTLYVPRGTRSRWDFWRNPSAEAAVEFFELDEGVVEAIKAIRSRADTLCLVSRNTETVLAAVLEKYGLEHCFDRIMLNGDKGKKISRFLHENGLRKEEAVMVGDMPTLDVFPVKRAGIEAVLVDRPYNRWAKSVERIRGIGDLPCWLRVADIAEDMESESQANSTLDDFLDGRGPPSIPRSTKTLISVAGA